MNHKIIGLASDHAGYELKQFVKQWLDQKGWAYKDFGTCSTESCDYADYAHPLASAVESGECYPGIACALCGNGRGNDGVYGQAVLFRRLRKRQSDFLYEACGVCALRTPRGDNGGL